MQILKNIPLFRLSPIFLVLLSLLLTAGSCEDKNQAYQRGLREGRNSGYSEGYRVGYDTGYVVGHNKGYAIGYDTGHVAGYDKGYAIGYDTGHVVGYDKGYAEGTKVLVGEGIIPTLGGAILFLAFAVSLIILLISLKARIKGIVLSAKEKQEKLKLYSLIDNPNIDITKFNLPILRDLEKEIIELEKTSLRAQKDYEELVSDGSFEKAKIEFIPEIQIIKDRLIWIRLEIGMAKIEHKKRYLKKHVDRIHDNQRLGIKHKLALYKELGNQLVQN